MNSSLALANPPGRLSPRAKLRLAGEIVASYARTRWHMRRGDLPSTVAALREGAAASPSPPDGDAYAAGLRLARAVSRTVGLLPADSRCLVRSLVVCALLARRGAAATLVIGVRPGEEFGAHAWVELGGRPLLPPDEGTYSRLVEL